MSTTPNQKDLLAKKSDLEGILKPDDNDVLHLPEVTITLAESGQFYLAGIDKKLLTLVGNTSGNAVALDGDAGLTFTTSEGSSTITGITSSSGNSTNLAASQSMVSAKQDALTAGTNITISNNTISATDTNTLSDLTDTAISSLADGQVLKYNATTGKWVNGAGGGGAEVILGTTAPTSAQGSNGNLYIQYDDTNNNTVTHEYVKISGAWEEIAVGGGGSSVIANPSGTATATLNKVEIDNVIYDLPSGGGGSGSSFEEEQLYKASSMSFSDITVDWDWDDYDLYILYSNDVLTQSGESTVLTKEKIMDLINNNQQISLYPYGDSGVCLYTPTANQLTAYSHTNSFAIIEIVGIKTNSGSGGGTGGVDTLWTGDVCPYVNGNTDITLDHPHTNYDYILVNTYDTNCNMHGTSIFYDLKTNYNYEDTIDSQGDVRNILLFQVLGDTSIRLKNYGQLGQCTHYTGFYGVKLGGGGSTVIPNPTGTPTDTLDTVSIDGTIYEIQGSGGGGSTVTITPTLSTGTKIADYSIDGSTGALYAPNGGGGGSGDSFITYSKSVTTTQYGWWVVEDENGNTLDPDTYVIIDISVNVRYYDVLWYQDSTGDYKATLFEINDGYTIRSSSTRTWTITYAKKDFSGGGGGSSVTPNPTGTPTDTLDTVSIDGTIYEIQGSGGGSGSGGILKGLDYANAVTLTLPDHTGYDYTPTGYGVLMATSYGGVGSIVITGQNEDVKYLSFRDDTWTTSWIPVTKDETYHVNRGSSSTDFPSGSWFKFIPWLCEGGGGASAVSDLTDVDLTNLEDGQILKYDATNQKWINADEGGGSTEVRRYLGQLCPRVTGTDSHISQSSNGSYGQTVWYSWGAFSDNIITTWGVPDSGAAWVDNHDNSPWISYHFDEPRYFTELTIDCGSNYGGSFTGSIYIEASNDGTAWVDIGGGAKTINAPYQSIGTNTYTLDDADTWEYIRIRGAQSFWILNTPSCFIQSINVYGGDIISKSKSDIVVVSRTDNTNAYAWLTPCDANGNTLKPSEVTLLSIFAEADMSGSPPYYNGLNLSVDTDGDKYCCKLYNTQTGGYAQDGTYSVDYTVAYIPNSGGSSGGDSTAAEEMTLDEYNTLPSAQRNDGTIRFIPNGSTIAETSAIDMSSISSQMESSMNVSSTSDQIVISWSGGYMIGGTFYYATPIDVTSWDKITFDLTTSSCYGGGSTAQQARWHVQIGLQSEAPSSVQVIDASDSRWIAVKDYANSNTTYDDQEIDVSELIGSYYLVINAHGWNAIIDDFTLEKIGATYPSQIKYMSKTYALEGDMHTYYTTEHQVGTWIDGSDVYEKTISISNVSLSSGSYETVDTITGLDTIISCNGYVVEGNLKYTLNDISLRVIQDGTSVKLYSPSGTTWTISSGAIIIRYTKVSS